MYENFDLRGTLSCCLIKTTQLYISALIYLLHALFISGDVPKAEVTILESKEFKNTVDKLLVKANLALVVGTSSWKEQFIDALTVSGSGDDDDTDEPTTPTYGDYMMHYLTVFWKLLFAIVPPTDIWGGWACFVASIVMIGVLTMVIGDVASHFGCTIGLADSVVAITFVALGTSLPGKKTKQSNTKICLEHSLHMHACACW